MSFGICNAPSTFQRCTMAILIELTKNSIDVFMGEFSFFGESINKCLDNLDKVLAKCQARNLVLNLEKCHYMVKEGILLGHKIPKRGLELDQENIEVIEQFPPLINVKGIKSFLGHVGFYIRFMKDFSKMTKPLCQKLQHDVPYVFSPECDHALNLLKKSLVSTPIVRSPDWSKPFELMSDSSNFSIRVVLGQTHNNVFHNIYYAIRTVIKAQINYTTTEQELLAFYFPFTNSNPILLVPR